MGSTLIGAGCTARSKGALPILHFHSSVGAGSIGGKGGGPTSLQAVPQILEASHLAMVMVTG